MESLKNNNTLGFLQSTPARVLTLILLLQAAVFYGFSRQEIVAPHRPLAELPAQLSGWSMFEEGVIEQEIQDVLKADELLNRSYINEGKSAGAHLFVAYYQSQRTGRAPHSPKNCLPGSGWLPSVQDIVRIPVGARGDIEVNRYIIQKGDAKSLVLYWYQSRDRTVASEYTAKFYVMADALRYNRTDTALIRVIVPIAGTDEAKAEQTATEFVQSFFNPLRQLLPA
jgi:EpsI family protein